MNLANSYWTNQKVLNNLDKNDPLDFNLLNYSTYIYIDFPEAFIFSIVHKTKQ